MMNSSDINVERSIRTKCFENIWTWTTTNMLGSIHLTGVLVVIIISEPINI